MHHLALELTITRAMRGQGAKTNRIQNSPLDLSYIVQLIDILGINVVKSHREHHEWTVK